MDRNETIAQIIERIKIKARLGCSVGGSRTQRFHVADTQCVTFNAPIVGQVISGLASSLRFHHFTGPTTHNIVISDRTYSTSMVFNRRVQMKFWKRNKVWEGQKVLEEIQLSAHDGDWAHGKDWAYGDADFPENALVEGAKLQSRIVKPITDKDLRRLVLALEEFDELGTWNEVFWYD